MAVLRKLCLLIKIIFYSLGPPDPPKRCFITNQTSDELLVHCTPGFNGGLKQYFQIEAWEHSQLLLNTTR